MIRNRRRMLVRSLAAMGLAAVTAWGAEVAPSRNLVRNPGFEEGEPGGDPADWGKQLEGDAAGSVTVSDAQAQTGKQSVLIQHTNERGYIHPNHGLTLKPGVYAYRVWARADQETSFRMELYDARAWAKPRPEVLQLGNGLQSQDFGLRPDSWQRFEMIVGVTEEFPASIQIGLRRPGRLWLDNVEIVPIVPILALADTGRQHSKPLSSAELSDRPGWVLVQDRATAFRGDVCLVNQQVAVSFRLGAPAAEFHAMMPDGGWRQLADLVPIGADGSRARAIQSCRTSESYLDKAVLDVIFTSEAGKPMAVRFGLKQGRRFVETEARAGVAELAVVCRSAMAAVPDFFGNDLVLNPARTVPAEVRLPRERMLLQFIEDGDAILALTWLSGDQEVRATLSGDGAERRITATRLQYRPEQRAGVWIGVIAAERVWQRKAISELTNLQGTPMAGPLPFPAGWRVDFRRREDGLIDAWLPTTRRQDGNWEFCRDNGSRTIWTSARGDFAYPAFIQDNTLFLANTRFAGAMRETFFAGADDLTFDPADVVLAYPWERTAATPPGVDAVMELVQQTLEETPEFEWTKLMLPAVMPRHRYPATCAVTGRYEQMFDRNEEQKQRRALIEELRRMDFFVLTKRERIEEYMAWMRRQQEWLTQARTRTPELGAMVESFARFLTRINDCYTKGRGLNMKTPADALALSDQVIELIDTKGSEEDKLAAAQELGKRTRGIGGAQDSVMGCMRQVTKELRQTAGYSLLTAGTEAEFALARDMRDRTVEMLCRTNGHEGR